MSWATIIAVVVVVASVMSVSLYLRRLVSVFSFAFCTLLMLHYQSSPAESLTAMSLLGGGLALTGPLRRLLRLRIF